MYEVKTDDIYKDMAGDKDLYDLADYPADHFLHDRTNNKVIGKFKDETKGEPIVEFIGLRPKMYSFVTLSMMNGQAELHEKHKAKGIQKAASDKLRHEHYRQQLELPYENFIANRRIGSINHNLFAIETQKRGLCAMDNKRYICDDNYHTLAYGHRRIPIKISHLEPEDGPLENVYSMEQAVEEGLVSARSAASAICFAPAGTDPAAWAEERRKWQEQLKRIEAATAGPAKTYDQLFPDAQPTTTRWEPEDDPFEGVDDDFNDFFGSDD